MAPRGVSLITFLASELAAPVQSQRAYLRNPNKTEVVRIAGLEAVRCVPFRSRFWLV